MRKNTVNIKWKRWVILKMYRQYGYNLQVLQLQFLFFYTLWNVMYIVFIISLYYIKSYSFQSEILKLNLTNVWLVSCVKHQSKYAKISLSYCFIVCSVVHDFSTCNSQMQWQQKPSKTVSIAENAVTLWQKQCCQRHGYFSFSCRYKVIV